jgi:hypothetical protein
MDVYEGILQTEYNRDLASSITIYLSIVFLLIFYTTLVYAEPNRLILRATIRH